MFAKRKKTKKKVLQEHFLVLTDVTDDTNVLLVATAVRIKNSELALHQTGFCSLTFHVLKENGTCTWTVCDWADSCCSTVTTQVYTKESIVKCIFERSAWREILKHTRKYTYHKHGSSHTYIYI